MYIIIDFTWRAREGISSGTEIISLLTHTRDAISRVPRMTRAVEGALGVGALGVRVTVVMEVTVLGTQRTWKTFIDV